MGKRQPPETGATRRRVGGDFSAQKAAQAQQTRMMRLAIPAIAPLVLLAVLSATRLMDTGQAGQIDYWAAAALVGLTPVVIVLLLATSRLLRRLGYSLLLAIDMGLVGVGLTYSSKSPWFYGTAGLFALAASYTIWALTQDRALSSAADDQLPSSQPTSPSQKRA